MWIRWLLKGTMLLSSPQSCVPVRVFPHVLAFSPCTSGFLVYFCVQLKLLQSFARTSWRPKKSKECCIFHNQLTVMIWNSLFCFCLYFCIFIIFHHQYYSVPHSVSSCARVLQSHLCVSERSEPKHVPILRLHYSVISGTLVFSKNLICFSFSGVFLLLY